ncbi:MAG: hypothetical protein HZB38_17990 [Planctomycetes bacterium]|nr:hypothetical protein [Planctomycetota bacterium]
MAADWENLKSLLARVEAGELDSLTPEQVARLEQHLHESPAAADRVGRAQPPTDRLLAAPIAGPSETEWAGVWSAVESNFASQRKERSATAGRVVSLGRAAAAIAACVAIFVLWRSLPTSKPAGEGWGLAVATNVEIHEVEVFGGRSSMLHFADDGSGAVLISVSDPPEDDTGA